MGIPNGAIRKILTEYFAKFLLASFTIFLSNVRAHLNDNPNATAPNLITYKEILDASINFSLQWSVNKRDNTIIFSIEADARRVVLGLTTRGQVNGADVVFCGVDGNGAPYVHDMHGGMSNSLHLDNHQDWQLLDGRTLFNRLQIKIQRKFDTCDLQDRIINSNIIDVIWDYGNDLLERPPAQINPKGPVKPIFFLDPIILPVSSNFAPEHEYRVFQRTPLLPRRTSYWCSIHKMNVTFQAPHHVYGTSMYFPNEDARRHIHHQLLYRCYAPIGIDPAQLFESFIGHPGEECYLNSDGPQLPTAWCREKVHVYLLGGEPVRLPDKIGFTIGETSTQYLMLETHYDNPDLRSDLVIENGVDLHYSSQLRPNNGSIMFMGHGVLGTFIVPPNNPSFNVVGHCSKDCIARMVTEEGAQIVGISLHGHTSARVMRLRHFRGTTESWILVDEDYRFDYQQVRFLQNPVTILPGDRLTMECTYDSTWKNGSAVLSGFSTRDEMCVAFLVMDKDIPYFFCSSEYPTRKTMERYGIQNMTWRVEDAERVINAASNPSLVGARLSEIVESQVWTPEAIVQLEEEQKFGTHTANCPNTRLVAAVAYLARQLTEMSGGLIQLPLIEQSVPTPRAINTPFPRLLPASYPRFIASYVPPGRCHANSKPELGFK